MRLRFDQRRSSPRRIALDLGAPGSRLVPATNKLLSRRNNVPCRRPCARTKTGFPVIRRLLQPAFAVMSPVMASPVLDAIRDRGRSSPCLAHIEPVAAARAVFDLPSRMSWEQRGAEVRGRWTNLRPDTAWPTKDCPWNRTFAVRRDDLPIPLSCAELAYGLR